MFDIPTKNVNFAYNDFQVYEEVIFFPEHKYVCEIARLREENPNNPNTGYHDIKNVSLKKLQISEI